MKLDIGVFFKNLSGNLKFHYNLTTVRGTLHEDQYKFLSISRSVLLRMRNVTDTSCREDQHPYVVYSNIFFLRIVPFMR
jgi:hypothetical protein